MSTLMIQFLLVTLACVISVFLTVFLIHARSDNGVVDHLVCGTSMALGVSTIACMVLEIIRKEKNGLHD